jgi:hypothetical protein
MEPGYIDRIISGNVAFPITFHMPLLFECIMINPLVLFLTDGKNRSQNMDLLLNNKP